MYAGVKVLIEVAYVILCGLKNLASDNAKSRRGGVVPSTYYVLVVPGCLP
jgi:hypothetical protein